MKNVDKALAILGKKELPKNAREEIDRLYKMASNDEKPLFSMIYEGLFLQENTNIKSGEN